MNLAKSVQRFRRYLIHKQKVTDSAKNRTVRTSLRAVKITSGQSNLTERRIAAAHGRSVVFARLRQCAPTSNTWFPGPTRLSIPNCISIGSAVLHRSRQRVPILYFLRHSVKIAPSHLTNIRFIRPTRDHISNDISIGSAISAVITIV